MSVIDEVKQKLDIVDVVSQTVKLRKSGRSFTGFCPFHQNTRTPSFYVFPDTQSWHCFGACGTGGDIFTFVMKKDNLDFGDALKQLAERAGVELQRGGQSKEDTKALLEIHSEAANYFHYQLKNLAAAQFARDYLKARRIAREAIENFQIGFAPNSLSNLREWLESKGYSTKEIERAGLIQPSDSGGGYRDRFRGRLIFPIRNRRGQTIAFGGRALAEDQQPKYLNSPETPLFSKSDVLYGLDLAKDAIRHEDLAVIVEGYTDVIIGHQAGFKNVVASMGTALTEKQLAQLRRLTKRYALALDADVAGEAATQRGLELARAALTRKQVPVPVGPGMIGFEERLDAELLVITLPEGRDPDEVILQNPSEWKELVATATPLVDYYFRAQTRELDLKTAHGKSEAVKRLLPVVEEINDTVQRTHYLQELARLAQTDERVLTQQLRSQRVAKVKNVEAAQPGQRPAAAKFAEYLLALALAYPMLLPHVKFLDEDDFEDGALREIWQGLRRYCLAPPHSPAFIDADEFLDTLSEAARGQALHLRTAIQPFEFSEDEAIRELETAAYRLRLRRYSEELTQLQFLLAEPAPQGQELLYQRANTLRTQIGDTQRALNARTILRRSA